MNTITIKRKMQDNNIYYYIDGQEIARSFTVPSNEILNPARVPEYKVRFLPESETIYGNFSGRSVTEAVASYINHKIYQHFGNKGIHSEIIDIY